jgi:hypothetical protein
LSNLPELVLESSFSSGNAQVTAGQIVTQTITAESPFDCECVLKIVSCLVDATDQELDPNTLCYDAQQIQFEQQELVGPRKRKSQRRAEGRKKAAPNPVEIKRKVTVGAVPSGVGRPCQVFARVTASATESINGQPHPDALWKDGASTRASILIA